MRVVPGLASLYLLNGKAEQEKILLSGFFGHLDSRSIESPNCKRSIHHEFHIAGSAGLVTSGRNLVRYIARGDQALGQRNIVFGEKNYLHATANNRIAVNRVCQTVDELDDEFRQPISRRSFTREKESAWNHLQVRIFSKPLVTDNDPQRIQQLPLVLVDTLDLGVEDGAGIHDLSGRRLEPVCKSDFGCALRSMKCFLKTSIAGQRFEAAQLAQVRDPLVADGFSDST